MNADLWIVPPPTHSAWFSRWDWYLNWQMCKGQTHRALPPRAEVYRVAEEHGLTVDSQNLEEDAPLMIGGEGLLPTKACVVLPYRGDLRAWLLAAKTVAFKCKAEGAHVFLPAGISKDQATKVWDKLTGDCTGDFTEDSEVKT